MADYIILSDDGLNLQASVQRVLIEAFLHAPKSIIDWKWSIGFIRSIPVLHHVRPMDRRMHVHSCY
jgi:hypothetical protein